MAVIKVPKKTDTLLRDGSQAMTGLLDLASQGTRFTDVILLNDGTYILAQRVGANSQTLRVYRTWTDANNGAWLELTGTLGGGAGFIAKANGTGSIAGLNIGFDGKEWSFGSGGGFGPNQSNLFDLATSIDPIRNGYFGTAAYVAEHTALTGRPAYKSADESLNTSTTLQNDDHLSVLLAASTKYAFKAWVFTNNAGATEGFKIAVNGTAGVTSLKAIIQIADDTLNTIAGFGRVSAFGSSVEADLSTGANLTMVAGTIETSTAGTLLLQWAQKTSGANNVTVQQGSYLEAERIP